VWFARFADAGQLESLMPAIAAAVAPLDPLLTAPSEFIRLEPTDRSNLR